MISQEVHIYLLSVPQDLSGWVVSGEAAVQLFTDEELKRYNRFLVQKKKAEFYLTRKFAKELLAKRLNTVCSSIELRADFSGKPFLFVDGQRSSYSINISHTSGLISFVVSKVRGVGIDVEYLAGPRDDLVQRFFHPHEIKDYMSLGQLDRGKRFYTLWTLKEAYLKATGDGLYTPLDSCRFSLFHDRGEDEIVLHTSSRQEADFVGDFRFFSCQLTEEHLLSVAVQTTRKPHCLIHRYSFDRNGSFICRTL